MSVAEAMADLVKLQRQRPALAASCAVLRRMLPALFSEPSAEVAPSLDPESAAHKLKAGIPLLRGETIGFHGPSFQRRWEAVAEAVESENDGANRVAAAYAVLDPSRLIAEVIAGTPEVVQVRAEELGLDAALTGTILRLSALPALVRVSAGLALLREPSRWEQGYCPTCGSWPLLGEFRGLEQVRFLRCGLCASDWQFPRLACPFCANRDHRQLGFFHVEGEENRYRAAVCEECRGYVKMVSTLSELSPPQLLVADLATVHLDLAAADRGYLVPS